MSESGVKRPWLVAGIILVLVIAGIVYQDNQEETKKARQEQLLKLQRELDESEPESSKTSELLKQARQKEAQARLRLQDLQQDNVPPPAAPAAEPEDAANHPATTSPTAETGSSGGEPMKGIGKFLADPKNREMIRLQQRDAIQAEYADLFQKMKLTADEREALLQILVEQQDKMLARFAQNGVNPTALAGDNTVVEEAAAQLKQIRDLLGETRYEQYRKFRIKQAETKPLEADGNGNQPASDNPVKPE